MIFPAPWRRAQHFSLCDSALRSSIQVLNGEAATSRAEGGLLIVGPEGDFTAAEKAAIVAAGAKGIGLGSLRLRVETAAIGLLSAVSFWPPARRR